MTAPLKKRHLKSHAEVTGKSASLARRLAMLKKERGVPATAETHSQRVAGRPWAKPTS